VARRKPKPDLDGTSPLSHGELRRVWDDAATRWPSVPPEHAGVVAVGRHVSATLLDDDPLAPHIERWRHAGAIVDAFNAAEHLPTHGEQLRTRLRT
jgi:hypothetical protein